MEFRKIFLNLKISVFRYYELLDYCYGSTLQNFRLVIAYELIAYSSLCWVWTSK